MLDAQDRNNLTGGVTASSRWTRSMGSRVVLITTASEQPRHQRRAQMLRTAGFDVRVYGFTRGLYPDNTYPEDTEVVQLGRLEPGKYVSRLPKLLVAASLIRDMEKKSPEAPFLSWAFGMDSAFISVLAMGRSVPLVYEVGDIRNPRMSRLPWSRIAYELESRVVRTARVVLVSSPAFLKDHYAGMAVELGNKGIVIENKLPPTFQRLSARPTAFEPRRPVRIGFIGLLRYPATFFPLLASVGARHGRYELHIYGDGPLRKSAREAAMKWPNVFYHGPFKNPDDLPRIYESIDLNYVVYDNRDVNVQMALPNKLYESIYFGRPLVVATDTELARRVTELGIGFVVDPRHSGFVDTFLDMLTPETIRDRGTRALALPLSYSVQNDDLVRAQIMRVIARGR